MKLVLVFDDSRRMVEWSFMPTAPATPCSSANAGKFSNKCDAFHFWSPHAGGGAHFLFADGSVRFLSYGAASVLPALSTRAGSEPVTLE